MELEILTIDLPKHFEIPNSLTLKMTLKTSNYSTKM